MYRKAVNSYYIYVKVIRKRDGSVKFKCIAVFMLLFILYICYN